MNAWAYVLLGLVHACWVQVSLSQEDLCEPSFGYETFIRLKEDASIGDVVLTLNTSGSGGDINLTLTGSEYFGFNATSQQLFIRQALDADGTNAGQSIRLKIICQEALKQAVEIAVTVTLVDVNDITPSFDNDHYYISLGETTSVGQLFDTGVRAKDSDYSFNNKAVYYTVQSGPYDNYFQFPDTLQPELILREALDFENLQNITITVVATNGLSNIKLSSTTLLTILVTDEDDLNPVFTSPLYEGQVEANAGMNTLVSVTPRIEASDADVTLNVSVVYSFHDAQGSTNVFDIDPGTGQVRLVGSIEPTKVSIVVQATQSDNPSRYGVAMLVITVAGDNSNAPRFQSDTYRVFVSEAVPLATTVLSVSATDQDFGSIIRYSIVGGHKLFAVAETSGAITVQGQMDYETEQQHSFTVMASDGNLNTTAGVVVRVVDANDNSPRIIATQDELTFQRERIQGEIVTTVQATDADNGDVLTYRLENYKTLFSIDSGTGVLTIQAGADDLTDTQYLILVVVSDNGAPPRETSVVVTVQFASLLVTEATTAMAGPSDDIVAIVLGVIAAVLLVVVVILVVYICRRRNQNSEQLDKAKASRSPDPRGLKFKNAQRGQMRGDPLQPFPGGGDDSLDGATSVQDNPLKDAGAFNYGFVHPEDPERDRNMDEIHIETAVIPFREADMYSNNNNNNNHHHHNNHHGEMFQQEDSSDYGDTLPHKQQHSLMNGLYPDTSTESLNTSNHTNSSGEGGGGGGGAKHRLLGNGVTTAFGADDIGTTSFGATSIGTTSFGMTRGGGQGALPAMSLDGLNPDVSVTTPEQKSELTVYF